MERPTRAKKNYRPAQVVLDHTIQRRTSEQVRADQAKAKMDAAAAESAAIAHKQSQLDQVTALEDALQVEDDAQSLEYLRPDLHIDPKSASNTDVDTLSDLRPILDKPVDALTALSPLAEHSSYRGSSYSEDFLTGWGEPEDRAVVEDENNENRDGDGVGAENDDYVISSDTDMEASQASEDQSQARTPGPVTKARKKKKNKARGIFRAAVNDARQVLPSQPPQLKKRRAPEPSPSVDANTCTKRPKPSEPGGLVPNWRRKTDVGILEHVARKHPIEFVDEEDDLVEGEFDKAEALETLWAVRASKPSTVRVDKKLVCDFHI